MEKSYDGIKDMQNNYNNSPATPAAVGVPVGDINAFENDINKRYDDIRQIDTRNLLADGVMGFENDVENSIKECFILVVLANAYSDSKAVDFTLRNFHILDRLSDDVVFYLPGYNIKSRRNDKSLQEAEENAFSDSHMRCIHHETVYSPRLGKLWFNEAEFADFVMEFTLRIPDFYYSGGCMMVIMPIATNHRPDYSSSRVYDFDKIIDSPGVISLDAFMHNAFNEIRRINKGIGFNNRSSISENDILMNLDDLYHQATSVHCRENRNELVKQDVIVDMEKCLNWSLREEFFFISYSSRNVMLAEMLKRTMQDKGLYVWIAPDGIPQGRNYSVAVPTAIHYAKNYVLILTEDSANSRWVQRELDVALNNDDTKVKVLLAEGYTIEDMRRNYQLNFYLNVVQIKFQYEDVINNEEAFIRFISE